MRCVIYSLDFEPITVIALDRWCLDHLQQHNRVSLQAIEEPPMQMPDPDEEITVSLRVVRLEAIWITRGDRRRFPVLFTSDEESALLLKSTFLAGQQRALQQECHTAFVRGAMWLYFKTGDSE